MALPESPTPSDTPEAGAPTDLPAEGPASADQQEATADNHPGGEDGPGAPIQDRESANEGGGAEAALLDEMYLTLGHLVAAHDLHRADSEKALKDLSKTAADLQRQREEALAEGDHMKYANAIRGLGEVSKIADILQHDAEDDLRGPDKSEDGDERGSGGSHDQRDSGSAGDQQPLAGPEDDREPERGPGGGSDGDAE